MNTPTRLAAYGAGVAVLAVGAYGVGTVVGPVGAQEVSTVQSVTAAGAPAPTLRATQGELPGGLQVSQDGYTLDPVSEPSGPAAEERFSFRVLGPDQAPVTRFTPTHDRPLHLVVVRRDLTGYQHVHPEMSPEGTWSVPLTFPAAGTYRAYADFRPVGTEEALTLGADVDVPGDYRPTGLPAPSRTAQADGYTVTLTGDLVPGQPSRLTLSVDRDGEPLTDLQPYLAAYGHLVALREDDLAYLHVHPDGAPSDGTTEAGPDVTFVAEVPSTGTYRLFLDFRHEGVVRTAELTARTTDAAVPPAGTAPEVTAPAAPATTGNGDAGHDH